MHKYCRLGRCSNIATSGAYCDMHKGYSQKSYNKYKRSKLSSNIYKSADWVKLRTQKLLNSPYCEKCLKEGKYVGGELQGMNRQGVTKNMIVHHIKEIDKRPDLAYDYNNLETLCRDCHGKIHGQKR